MAKDIIELQKWIHDQTQLIAKKYIINRFLFVYNKFEGHKEQKMETLKFIQDDVTKVTEDELKRSIAKYYPLCNRNVLRVHIPTINDKIRNMLRKTIKSIEISTDS